MSETPPIPDPGGSGSPSSSSTPAPGDVRPRRTLDRPPSARFQAAQGAASTGPESAAAAAAAAAQRPGGTRTAVAIAILGAVASAGLNAILAVTTGLVAVAGLTAYLIGLALRQNPPARAPCRSAGTSHAGLAIVLALFSVAAAAAGAWLVAIPQGNLLDPLDYLGQTLGLVLAGQGLAAVLGAWLGSR